MAKIISKDKLGELISKLSDYEVIGPVLKGDVVVYGKLSGKVPDFTNSEKPPKDVLFPQTEKMFDFKKEGNTFQGVEDVQLPAKPVVLLGVRPCDARAMVSLDRLFNWDYADPYFNNNKERTTVVSFSCVLPTMPLETCFCTSVGGSPGGEEGADMLWTDLGDKYLVESFTDKGEKVLSAGGGIFTDASGGDESAAKEAKDKAADAIVRKVDLEGVAELTDKVFANTEYWESFANRCLGCGICTLLCPTCHCFDINDVIINDKGWRERTWDSCQFGHYTVHASGHNPRPAQFYRQRNRILHKFSYMHENLDEIGCVGCGRCIARCPVNIDIIEVIEGLKEVAQ